MVRPNLIVISGPDKVLPEEGRVVHIKRPKYLFTERDVCRLLRTPWTEDDLIFIPQRYLVQFHIFS
jgi:hypothetical protein